MKLVRFDRIFACMALTGVMATACPAAAQTSAAAEALFQDARKLMEAKRYSEACPKFLASQKADPAIGTLLNLADCYEKNNQLASAWAKFHEAIALAQRTNRLQREQTAKERADKLEPRLIKLTILARASGLDVKLDGTSVDAAALGSPIPVDAGQHRIEATAAGKKPFTKDVEVNEKLKNPSVDIPPLEDEPKAVVEPPPLNTATEPPREESKAWSTQKTLGVVAGGVGIVGVGVGVFFGIRTSSKWNSAKAHCSGTPLDCDQTGVDFGTQAHSSGIISTIALIASGVFVVGGAVLFFTAPKDKRVGSVLPSARELHVGVGPGSLMLGGSFQ